MNTWSFEILTDWDEIWGKVHLARWNEYFKCAFNQHVFFESSIVKAWTDTYRPIRDLTPIFIWAKDSKGNIAFLPLVLWQRNWKNAFIRSIVPIGYSDFDYHNPIFNENPQDINSFWKDLQDCISQRFKYDEFIIDGITDSYTDKSSSWHQQEICPWLSLKGINNEDDLYTFLPTKLRGDIRRQIRRLNDIGTLTYQIFQTYEDAIKTFDAFMTAHRKKWPNAYKATHFHERILKEGLLTKCVHFSSLNLNNTPIAWHLGFQHKGRYYYYMPAGNYDFAKYSPVKIHLFYLIKDAIHNKFEIFDHLRGNENYKNGWSNDYQHVHSLRFYDKSIVTNIKLLILKTRRMI